MGHGSEESRWFMLAAELASTGRYRNAAEVEKALKTQVPGASLPENNVLRHVMDGNCYRARCDRGWDT